MTSFAPGYGETPISADEAESLRPEVREALGSPASKAAVFDLEQAVQQEVAENLLIEVLYGACPLDEPSPSLAVHG